MKSFIAKTVCSVKISLNKPILLSKPKTEMGTSFCKGVGLGLQYLSPLLFRYWS